MSGKSLSELEKWHQLVCERFEKLRRIVVELVEDMDTLVANNERLLSENESLRVFIKDISVADIQKFHEQADAEHKRFQEWVIHTLMAACEPTTDLPIDKEVYKELQSLAHGKGLSLRDFGMSEDISEVLHNAILNRYI